MIDIPGAMLIPDSEGSADLVIAQGRCPVPPNQTVLAPYRYAADWIELTVPQIARYVLADGHLWIDPFRGASLADISALLVASGLPLALWHRGGFLLHASAATAGPGIPGIAVAGASQTGKSAVLAGLVANGNCAIADDSLWIRNTANGWEASGLPGGCFSRKTGQQSREFLAFPSDKAVGEAPVKAIVFLTSDGEPGRLGRLTGVQAIEMLLRHRHRPKIPAMLGREAEVFTLAALLCDTVPMYALAQITANPEPGLAILQRLLD